MIDSLHATLKLMQKEGHEGNMAILSGNCYIQTARNELVNEFMKTDCDSLFFLDDDVSFNPKDALNLMYLEDEIVAGIYRKKREDERYPVVIDVNDEGYAICRADGLIQARFIPTGFLRIKRSAIEKLYAAYPDRKYPFRDEDGEEQYSLYDLFPQGLHNGQWVGEDFGFCRLWNEIKGEIWVVPDITLTHHSAEKSFIGNYHEFLMKQPGGSNFDPGS